MGKEESKEQNLEVQRQEWLKQLELCCSIV